MRLDKFTLRGQEAIQSAIERAEKNQHQQVEPEHLLVAMLEQPEGIVRPILIGTWIVNFLSYFTVSLNSFRHWVLQKKYSR